jgi:aminopeptidase-like protein
MLVNDDAGATGRAMHALASDLFPICRSVTGEGVRRTLAILRNHIPLSSIEVPSGTAVFDWVVPDEWNIRGAWIDDERGERIVDFRANNLHVVNYSTPIRCRMALSELKPHLHSLPDQPDLIPYRTTYYKETWGFCLSHRQLQQLDDGFYDVCIDSTLQPGHLTMGEYYLRGDCEEEVLISVHICHPSLANDNLSGISLAVASRTVCKSVGGAIRTAFFSFPAPSGRLPGWLSMKAKQGTSNMGSC